MKISVGFIKLHDPLNVLPDPDPVKPDSDPVNYEDLKLDPL